MNTAYIYAEQIEPVFVRLADYNLAMINKADINGGGTTGGVWYQDAILSDLFPNYKQVIRVLGGQMAIEYGNVQLDVHRFVVTSVSGLKVKVGSAEYTVFHTGNFNPDSKANTDGSNASGALAATIANNHTHANKSVLDSITAQDLIDWDNASAKSHNALTLGANAVGMDLNVSTQRLQFQNGYQLPTTIKLGEYDEAFLLRHSHTNKVILDNLTQSVIDNSHTHGNKALLDSYNQTNANIADAVSLRHSHINKAILDAITAAYTTADKNTLDALAGIQLEADQANALIRIKDGNGNVLSTLNVAFLNNEGTQFVYNPSSNTLDLINDYGQTLSSIPVSSFVTNLVSNANWNGTTPNRLDFKDNAGTILFSIDYSIANIQGLQAVLNSITIQISNKANVGGDNLVNLDAWRTNLAIGALAALTTTHKTTIVGAINEVIQKQSDVKIGGRNYVLGSDKYLSDSSIGAIYFNSTELQNWRGKTVTVSVDIDLANATGSRLGFEVAIMFQNGNIMYVGAWYNVSQGANFKGRISTTHDIPDLPISHLAYNGIYIQCNGTTTIIGRPKLEFGNKASDWTPAIEDYNLEMITRNGNSTPNHSIFKGGVTLTDTFFNDNTQPTGVYMAPTSQGDLYIGRHSNRSWTGDLGWIRYNGELEWNKALIFNGQTNSPTPNKTGIYSVIAAHAGGGANPVTTLTTGLVDHIGIEKVGYYFKKIIFAGPNTDADIFFRNGSYTVASEEWAKSFGLGNLFPEAFINVDDNRGTGFYNIYGGWTGGNKPYGYACLIHVNFNNVEFGQLAIQQGAESMSYRIKDGNGNVRNWVKLWDILNLPNPATETYVDNKVAAIPTHNGQLTVNTTADLVGGYVYLPSGNVTTTLGLATHILNAIADGQAAYNWGNHATAGYASVTYVNQQIANVATPKNGSFVVQGVGALTGAGSTSADTANNSVATLDLTSQWKSYIAAGVDANNKFENFFGGVDQYAEYTDVSSGGFYPTTKAFFNVFNPLNVPTNVDVEDHFIHGARLILQGVKGAGTVTYHGNFIDQMQNFQSFVNLEFGSKEYMWDSYGGWREVF